MLLPVHVDICGGTQQRQHVTTKPQTQLDTNPFSQFILAPSVSTYFSWLHIFHDIQCIHQHHQKNLGLFVSEKYCVTREKPLTFWSSLRCFRFAFSRTAGQQAGKCTKATQADMMESERDPERDGLNPNVTTLWASLGVKSAPQTAPPADLQRIGLGCRLQTSLNKDAML